MKGVVIFLVLTLVLFMAEPVEPGFRSSVRHAAQRFKESKYPGRLKNLGKGMIKYGPAWVDTIGNLVHGNGAPLDDEMS